MQTLVGHGIHYGLGPGLFHVFLIALSLANIWDMFLVWWTGEMQQSKILAQEHFKPPFLSYLLTSHQLNQVKWANLKSGSRTNTQSPQPMRPQQGIWVHYTRGERRTGISYSHSHGGGPPSPSPTPPPSPFLSLHISAGIQEKPSLHLCRMVTPSFRPEALFSSPKLSTSPQWEWTSPTLFQEAC